MTTQLLFIQWLDNFQAHARMALPPADFVVASKRHAGLLSALFGAEDSGAVLTLGARRQVRKNSALAVPIFPPLVLDITLAQRRVSLGERLCFFCMGHQN